MTRPYHHGNLPAALVEEAVDLARQQGADGVVLREVARRAGVSHNAAYRHFADREELLREVAAIGMSRLADAMQLRIAAVDETDPVRRARERLREVGRAYVHFALAEPGLFDVAFSSAPTGGPTSGPTDASHDRDVGPYALLTTVLDELAATGTLPAARRAGAEVTCWSAVHGFAVLHLRGPLRDQADPERESLLDALLDVVEQGLR